MTVHRLPLDKPEPNADFEAFWNLCPLKVGKLLAEAKFRSITNGGLSTRTLDKSSGEYVQIFVKATASELIEAMRAYRQSRIDPLTYDTKPYTLHPATWLNSGRWLDE